jgi:hypothetical protein
MADPLILTALLFFIYSEFAGHLVQKGLFFLESFCLILVSSTVCNNPLKIFCNAGLVPMNSFSFSLF